MNFIFGAPNFRISHYDYDEPLGPFNPQATAFRYSYSYHLEPDFSKLSIRIAVTMYVDSPDKEFSHIITDAEFSLEEEAASSRATYKAFTGIDIYVSKPPISQIAEAVQVALDLTSKAMLLRQSDTVTKGFRLPVFSKERLIQDIEKRGYSV